MKLRLIAASLLLLFAGTALAGARSGPIELNVDIRDTERKLFHAEMVMPVTPGPLTLYFPKWIPGEHAPSGPVGNLAGVVFRVEGKQLTWQRDPEDMYSFHLEIPAGAEELHVSLDFLSPTGSGDFTAGVSVTPKLAVLNWNQVLLYPEGFKADNITYEPTLRIPEGWDYATALDTEDRDGNRIEFSAASLYTMVDSPVLTGAHFRTVDITPAGGDFPHHDLNLAGDMPQALAISDKQVAAYRQLVREAYALFGSFHYPEYDFLYTLSDYTAHFGLEHHASSDNRTGARSLIEEQQFMLASGLLPHELVHSWNGKYRRPIGEAFGNYDERNRTGMLWVYEGLTTYLGDVLTGRSGLRTPEQVRAALAYDAAQMDHVPGRSWRPLRDTAVNAQVLYGTPNAWSNWRRGVDFYPEGLLLWLDVDTKIRELSDNRKSLDNFTQRFFAPDDRRISVKPYDFNEIVTTLNEVQPHDWAQFLNQRLDRMAYGAPLDGISRGGWKLVYRAEPTEYIKALEGQYHFLNQMFGIGFTVDDKGRLGDVLWNGPAFKAGLGAGMHLVAVNDREFSLQVLKDEITAAQQNGTKIELLTRNEGRFRTYTVNYQGGLKYPQLERIEGEPDYLTDIISAHAK